MRIKPLWVVLAGGLVILGVVVDLAVASRLAQTEPTENANGMPGSRVQRELDEARWMEAREAARTVANALHVHHQRLGSFQGVGEGPAVQQASLEISPNSLNLRHFRPQDIRIVQLDSNTGGFTIEVRGTLSHSPSGALQLNERGEVTRID